MVIMIHAEFNFFNYYWTRPKQFFFFQTIDQQQIILRGKIRREVKSFLYKFVVFTKRCSQAVERGTQTLQFKASSFSFTLR